MANELALNLRVTYAKSGTSITWPDTNGQSITVTVAGTRFVQHRQAVGTSEEALELGDIATGGYAFFFNRDTTNYVSIRQATGGTNLIRINAGEWAAFRFDTASAAPFAIANTASVELECLILAA